MRKKLLLGTVALLGLFSCQQRSTTLERVSTLDSCLQTTVDSLLHAKMNEVNAISGHAIVMEVKTGEVKAMIGGQDSQKSRLVRTAILLAALETGKVTLTDIVDTESGEYIENDTILRDHNWFRGGYGELSILDGFCQTSDIANYKMLKMAFDSEQEFYDSIAKMCYGTPSHIEGMDSLIPSSIITPEDSAWTPNTLMFFCQGHNHNIAPIQTLAFFNAIANDGTMVKPMLYKGATEIINQQIVSAEAIDSVQFAMIEIVNRGLSKRAKSERVQVAGLGSSVMLTDNNDTSNDKSNTLYNVQFCGYFPAENPKYSIIVGMNKWGLPASGGAMGAPLFKDIVESILRLETR